MPSPEAHLEEFLADVKGLTNKFTLGRSSLKSLIEHLQKQIKDKSVVHFDPVDGDVDKAVVAAKAKCKNPNDLRLTKYEPAIRRLASVWSSSLKDYPIVPIVAPDTITPFGAVKLVKNKLEEMSQFASMDAFANCVRRPGQPPDNWRAGFAGCIKESKRNEVMRRHDDAAARGARTGVGGGGIAGFGAKKIEWADRELEKARQKVFSEKAGICILFAKAAGYILSNGLTHGPRLEIVTYKNHAFVVVGRLGPGRYVDAKYTLPHSSYWGDNWVIVDGWAGAMGHSVIYQKDAGYPYPTMLNPVELVMGKDAW